MPWPTTDGREILAGDQAELVRQALQWITARTDEECDHLDNLFETGIRWFDQWDPEQRLWLLETVGAALLSEAEISSSAAIFDATVDAIFLALLDPIAQEIDAGTNRLRTCVLRAYRQAGGTAIESSAIDIDQQCDRSDLWGRCLTAIADRLLGPRSYTRAESFRDGDYRQTQAFLRSRGLPDDYLTRLPPSRTPDQANQSVQRLRELGRH